MSTNPPQGFLFSSCTAGIKASGKPDLALIHIPDGASAAAMFTRNQVVAAPLIVGREHLQASAGQVHAVIINAGNANCATGKPGIKAAQQVCADLARKLKINPTLVFPSSTGIIGMPLPVEKITAAVPGLIGTEQGDAEAFEAFANAILTTDTHRKIASQSIVHGGVEVRVVGVAKGAGMIHPNMATMLVYLLTDAIAAPKELQRSLRKAADQSFNNISIDGDTSTNDTVLLLASGKSGVLVKQVAQEFDKAVQKVCRSLAGQIVADGEGVKHVVRLNIEQAKTVEQARQIARTIATSPLVKTAWAGADPNWGRILAAIGRSGVPIDQERISIYLGDQQICRKGGACPFDAAKANQYMSEPAYEIRVILGAGDKNLEFLSCDLTAEYVRINADYST
ncbi:MAG: bifunctional glutamate N-acetyltransferase/amino-acid acetyltransferase ArgJ [Acidobacteriia bacterium]|nr:bifunctional glutamate N-acetyltransferase/amino-acid acetyltransferase ArgJ [Terriglobia bacterium]